MHQLRIQHVCDMRSILWEACIVLICRACVLISRLCSEIIPGAGDLVEAQAGKHQQCCSRRRLHTNCDSSWRYIRPPGLYSGSCKLICDLAGTSRLLLESAFRHGDDEGQHAKARVRLRPSFSRGLFRRERVYDSCLNHLQNDRCWIISRTFEQLVRDRSVHPDVNDDEEENWLKY